LQPWGRDQSCERDEEIRVERRREEPQREIVTREMEYYAHPDPPPQPLVSAWAAPDYCGGGAVLESGVPSLDIRVVLGST